MRLSARTAPAGLRADGADLALIEVEVVDAAGRRSPIALDMIDFSLSGPAEWRGGIAQGPDNYILAKRLPVEGGVNRVLVRSLTQAGKIVLSANAAGLKGATLTLESRPVAVKDGLGLQLAAAALPSYLGRGPTPATPSLSTPLRIPANDDAEMRLVNATGHPCASSPAAMRAFAAGRK